MDDTSRLYNKRQKPYECILTAKFYNRLVLNNWLDISIGLFSFIFEILKKPLCAGD
ncbi:hypothetical protein GCM10027049_28930 [Mucilaginibacter puniceus]